LNQPARLPLNCHDDCVIRAKKKRGGLLSSLTLAVIAATLLSSAGCTGNIGDGRPRGGGPATQCAVDIKARPGLRLSSVQYINTVRDLVGDDGFEADLEDEPGLITKRAARQLRDAAEDIIARRDRWTRDVFPCDTTGAEDLACRDAFIDSFGRRAFRRPLTDTEKNRLTDVYDFARGEGLVFDGAMDVVLQVMLQSPAFVYLFEDGVAESTGALRLLTDHEVAARLSYFLWSSTPDDELMASASAGDLSTVDGLRAEAERLLEDPRAKNSINNYMAEFLQLNGGRLHHPLAEVTKDTAMYPEVDAALLAAMRVETSALIERVVFGDNGTFEDLFTSREAYVNGPLATLYGIADGPPDADTYEWVTLPEDRAGLLTRAAFLTTYSTATVTAPIRRGVWIRNELLCHELGEPPGNVDDTPLEGGANGEGEVLTVREATEVRTMTEGQCAGCHSLINPLGYAFEGFDAIGRTQENEIVSGQPVDTFTHVTSTDFDGSISDAVAMSEALAASEEARSCFASKFLESALGGEPPEACAGTQDAFVADGNIKNLLISIIASDAFRYLNIGE
jgi:hypothetical protein